MKIVLAEDELGTRNMMRIHLESRSHQVTTCSDGICALETVLETQPELLLLDIGMPELDGWAVLKAVRRHRPKLPVLIITALDSPDDAAKGLGLGADDYVRKPVGLNELDARIDSVVRRLQGPDDRQIVMGPLVVDNRQKTAIVEGESLRLTPKEFSLLKLLASDAGRVFSNHEIVANIWGENSKASKDDVKQYVHLLRKKLNAQARERLALVTVSGFGYRLEVRSIYEQEDA